MTPVGLASECVSPGDGARDLSLQGPEADLSGGARFGRSYGCFVSHRCIDLKLFLIFTAFTQDIRLTLR